MSNCKLTDLNHLLWFVLSIFYIFIYLSQICQCHPRQNNSYWGPISHDGQWRLRSIYNKPLLRQQNKITSDIFSFIPALAGHPKMAPALPTDLTRRVWFHTPASTCRQGGGVCGTPCHLSSFCSETCKHSLALGFIPSSGGSGSLRPHFPVSSKTIFESHTYIETHKHTHNLMWDR